MASWITAVAALLAVVLAGLTLFVVKLMHSALSRRFELVQEWFLDHRREQQRAQADQVAAWPVSERETFEKIITRGVVGAAVRNASSMPVYELEIVYRDPDAAWTAVKHVRQVPPSETPEVYAGFDDEETSGTPNPERINADGTIRLAPSADMHIELRFTDAQGRRWMRDDRGVLTQTGEPGSGQALGGGDGGSAGAGHVALGDE
jgi:hypothetical protein